MREHYPSPLKSSILRSQTEGLRKDTVGLFTLSAITLVKAEAIFPERNFRHVGRGLTRVVCFVYNVIDNVYICHKGRKLILKTVILK